MQIKQVCTDGVTGDTTNVVLLSQVTILVPANDRMWPSWVVSILHFLHASQAIIRWFRSLLLRCFYMQHRQFSIINFLFIAPEFTWGWLLMVWDICYCGWKHLRERECVCVCWWIVIGLCMCSFLFLILFLTGLQKNNNPKTCKSM